MHESRAFKLTKDSEVKTKHLELHKEYELLDTLQKSYLQGLDTEFIPPCIRHIDIINQKIFDDTVFTNSG
jgi:DNA primase large subunit